MQADLHGGNIYDHRVDLDFSVNLNPLGCPKPVKQAVAAAANELQAYPQLGQELARQSIAALEGVDPALVVCASGASELFMAIVHALQPREALLLQPGFSGYGHALAACPQCRVRSFTLQEENAFQLREDVLTQLTPGLDVFFLAAPNNPTGRAVEPLLLQKILQRCEECGIWLVLDECFADLSDGGSCARQAGTEYSKLIVVRAFTKTLAVPGVRFGYAIAHPEVIRCLGRQLPEWNISVFAQAAAISGSQVLQEERYLAQTGRLIARERAYLTRQLKALGLRVIPSESSFLLLFSGCELQQPLLKKGILIRSCSNFPGLGPGWYRIAVKKHKQNRALLCALKEVLSET